MSIKTELDKLETNIDAVADNLDALGYDVSERTMKGLIDATKKPDDYLCFTSIEDGSTIAYGTLNGKVSNIEKSTDKINWTSWDGTQITLNNNEYIYIRNTTRFLTIGKTSVPMFWFSIVGKVKASGNIMSLLNFNKLTPYCFYELFNDCNGLITAPKLPATELAPSCYESMFESCDGLIETPELPATILSDSCYKGMFSGCAKLTKVYPLNATKLEIKCYSFMFYNCELLKVNENGTGNKIFTCPSEVPTDATFFMFNNTGGTFTGTPTANNTYNWYE